jgi:putative transcriptional regulator
MPADPFLDDAQAFALGTMEEDARSAFGVHSARCGACAAAVAEWTQVTGALAQAAPVLPPPPALRRLVIDLSLAPSLPLDLGALAWEETDPGVRQAVLGQDPDNGVTRALLWGKPGARYPSHRHLGEEALLVLQGSCRDEAGEYHPGSVSRKRPGTVHTVEFLPGDDCIGYVVSYGGHERTGPEA